MDKVENLKPMAQAMEQAKERSLRPITHKEFNGFIKGKGFKGRNKYTLKELKAMFGFKPMDIGSSVTIYQSGGRSLEEPVLFLRLQHLLVYHIQLSYVQRRTLGLWFIQMGKNI